MLHIMRKAALNGTLEFTRDTAILESLIFALKKNLKKAPGGELRLEDIFQVASEWGASHSLQKSSHDDLLTEVNEGPVEKIVNGGGVLNLCRNVATALTHSMNPPDLPPGMIPRTAGNADWYWPFLLMK
jgi:hypothetical protein